MATVRYFAAARAATGLDSESVDAATVDELRDELSRRHGEPLARILPSCGLLLSGVTVHDRHSPVGPDDTVDVLPPFAGG
ncbi:MoaD/ThiS family protein [Stackebrandtia soli]|uniref:MoaD/ThiS family protein n=1 Tax=Stackebrandtia soli TaxID=1892856 RepID=UPI0039E8B4F3